MKLARKYACRYQGNDGSYQHTSGYGTPTRKKCARCAGPLDAETGLWGVFTWTGTGRYPEDAAHWTSSYNHPTYAQGYADREHKLRPETTNLVVRWIPKVPS